MKRPERLEYRISGSEFYDCFFFGPNKFSGLSGNGPQAK